MKQQPVEILITNDDGYTSKGINFLAGLLEEYGNVTVVAPDVVQSGMSAALSMGRTLRLEKKSQTVGNHGNSITVYSLTGTPVDCVKMAMNKFFKAGGSESVEQDPTDRGYKPHIIFSGINHGSNASIASLYSGTLGAAAEGAIYGVKSVGLSINTHHPDPDFTQIESHLRKIIANAMDQELPQGVYLNVNFPAIPAVEIKGIKIAKQGNGMWHKEFEQRQDPYGRHYYWMTGNFKDLEQNPENKGDHNLMDQGYITIVPHKIDTTCYATMEQLENGWKL